MGQVRGKSLPELLQLLRQARRQRARREQCQGSHCRPAMVETCESTSAGMGWAEVEAPLAYRAAAVVEMARPQRPAMKDRNSAAVAAATEVWYLVAGAHLATPVEMVIQTGPVAVQAVAANLARMAAMMAQPVRLAAIPVMRLAPMAVGREANSAGRVVQPARSAATLVMMVEMEVPTSLLDQFLNL